MRAYARLNIVDNAVLCPRTCRWEAVDHCALCRELAAIERGADRDEVVACYPDLAPPGRTVASLAHGG